MKKTIDNTVSFIFRTTLYFHPFEMIVLVKIRIPLPLAEQEQLLFLLTKEVNLSEICFPIVNVLRFRNVNQITVEVR